MVFCFMEGAGTGWPPIHLPTVLCHPPSPRGSRKPQPQVLRLPGVSSESVSLGNSESACIRFLLSNPLILLFLGLLGALLSLVRITSLLMLWASVSQAAVSQTFCLCSIAGLCVSVWWTQLYTASMGGCECLPQGWALLTSLLGAVSPSSDMGGRGWSCPSTLQRIRGICSGHCGLGFSSDELSSRASDEKPSGDWDLGGGLLTHWCDLESCTWWRPGQRGGQVVGLYRLTLGPRGSRRLISMWRPNCHLIGWWLLLSF